jgi:hypothetical protein
MAKKGLIKTITVLIGQTAGRSTTANAADHRRRAKIKRKKKGIFG